MILLYKISAVFLSSFLILKVLLKASHIPSYLLSLYNVFYSSQVIVLFVYYLFNSRMISQYETVGGMKIGRRNQSTQRKPAPVMVCHS
jgi:hypothetical protein